MKLHVESNRQGKRQKRMKKRGGNRAKKDKKRGGNKRSRRGRW